MAFRFVSSFPHFDLQDVQRRTSRIDEAMAKGELGCAVLPYAPDDVRGEIYRMVEQVRGRYKHIIVVGIGGSDLGTRAVHRALNHSYYNQLCEPKLCFVGDTTDPVPLQETLDVVDLRESLVVMVSKSGNTIEQMSVFLYLRDRLKEVVGERFAEHIIAITDPATGTMRDLVNQEGYRALSIPPAVGGRFSVLSAVGLFPLALVNIDTEGLLAGARHVLEYEREAARAYAAGQCAAYHAGQHIHVMMPYCYGLREFGFWFRQLWAESLGKARSLDGQEVRTGPTPVAALGPADQHSQLQLYQEGPKDKTFTFVTVASMPDTAVPQDIPTHEQIAYLKGIPFRTILAAEQAGTEEALREDNRPTYTIEIDELDAFHVGGLLMFFELATVYAGALLNVNAFDQPGVERGKQLTHSKLSW
jgi:glucose-6-phosphate isomerase